MIFKRRKEMVFKDITIKEIRRVVKYLQRKHPEAEPDTIKEVIVRGVRNVDDLKQYDSIEQFADAHIGILICEKRIKEHFEKKNKFIIRKTIR